MGTQTPQTDAIMSAGIKSKVGRLGHMMGSKYSVLT